MPTANRVKHQSTGYAERRRRLATLAAMVEDAPAEWFTVASSRNGVVRNPDSVEAEPCDNFATVEAAWDRECGGALYWRRDLADALAVLLAVAASTKQGGNQLFLDLIGSPGSAKTTLCRGLLVSGHCVHVENITKILSGFKKPGDGEKDCSFLARADDKTWVTCEFDVLASSPDYHQLMGKIRRIFHGETTATYGNSDIDRVYTALRTPWIRAGTHKMVDHDQSQLGDRFLRIIIGEPDLTERRAIALAALESEDSAMGEATNATAGSVVDTKTRRAHALTGGYVDWLRAHVEDRLARVEASPIARERCIDLAEIAADLRARPHEGKHKDKPHEAQDGKELPTRLARQYHRLAKCLAVVLNRAAVDGDVLRIVRKVALDTACGYSLRIVQWLCAPNHKKPDQTFQQTGGLGDATLAGWLGVTTERAAKYMTFLRGIGVAEYRSTNCTNGGWVLSERVYALFQKIMSER